MNIYVEPSTVFKNITTHLSHKTTSLLSKQMTQMCNMPNRMWSKSAKTFFFSFCLFNLILCWMLFLATILWRMAKYILKTTQTSGSKIKHWCLMQWCTTVTGVKFWQKRVSSSLDCLRMLVMKRFNTCNVQSRGILEPLTPKTKLCDNQFYVHCVK